MKRSFNPSAAQTALLSALGGLIAACGVLVLAPHESSPSLRYMHVAISVALCAIGFPLWLKAQRSLKDGIQNNRWPPEQIELLTNILDSLLLRILTWALLLAAVGIMIFFSHAHGTIFGLSLLILGQTLMHLTLATKRPPPYQYLRS